MSGDGYTIDQLDGFEFPEETAVASEEHNPEVQGYAEFDQPGWYKCEISTSDTHKIIVKNQKFKWKDERSTLSQYRPILRCVEGPCKGASLMDFLPMPTSGQEMAAPFQDRWVHFLKRAGIEVPGGRLFPKGFQPSSLIGRKLWVNVVADLDMDTKEQKLKPNGQLSWNVALFGYDLESETKNAPGSEPAKAGSGKKASTKAEAKAKADEIQL